MFQADIGNFVDLAKLLYQQSIEELLQCNEISKIMTNENKLRKKNQNKNENKMH